jgi:5-methylcytosine-specific restriction protein A
MTSRLRRAAKVCSRPGCANLVTGRGSLCVEHERARQRSQFHRRKQAGRITDYGPEWPVVRNEYILNHPFCVVCGGPATQVDHITPVSKGGSILDWGNLQSLCHRHHSQKTARHDGGFGNAG